MKFTKEQINTAKTAKDSTELNAMAKDFGITLSDEDALKLFNTLNHKGNITDNELENVYGGCASIYVGDTFPEYVCPGCGHQGLTEGFDEIWYLVCPDCLNKYSIDKNGNFVCYGKYPYDIS